MLNVQSDFISIEVECTDWKDVVDKGLAIFEEKEYVTSKYKEAIFKSFEEYGPYMVIAPSILLLHARPEDGVIKTGLGIMVLKNPINFGSELNDPVKLVFTLSSKDNTSHTTLLANLMKLLINKEYLDKVINANKVKDILDILKKVDL